MIPCPNHEGNFDCTPFCNLCEGNQEITQKEHALAQLDLAICWECAETRPVFAHDTCQQIDNHITKLKEVIL